VEYLLAAAIVAGMTVTPVPLPPSWLVVAYLSVELDANAAGIVVAAALGAAAGRTALAAWTRALGPRLMGRATRENVDYLAAHLHGRRTTAGVATVLVISPPPAGALYTAAGLLRVNLALVGASCFAGRLVTFGLAVALAGAAAGELADRLRDAMSPWHVALGLAAFAVFLWLLGRIDWRATLTDRRPRLRARARAGRAASPGEDPAPRG
jgi:membrane protein YqaA with SNARE-associated domain